MGKVTYSLRLSKTEYITIRNVAYADGSTLREWIRQAIREKLQKAQEPK